MGESLLLITLITLIVITIRRARPVILENPVIIQRPGQYHITLAPQLNRAQTFIEQIATRFSKSHSLQSDFPSRYFEVRDPKVFARGADCYLLAVTLRDGLLYFQATSPVKSHNDESGHLKTISEFSEKVLKQHPQTDTVGEPGEAELADAVQTVAKQLQIEVKALT
ncbi:MAG: Uncharacterized protein AWT59_2354 [Candidatus Gallionella acididurans]|uniref:Uncharacterized protein n=1 Tax=Candidatus Gallionella acididurans TaxID=1796491 RepID=A0A139BRU3_9PROT|nr:MAG: Uncharacterized protein AWT59_2354 [Candidatus Gallionella acididurans]